MFKIQITTGYVPLLYEVSLDSFYNIFTIYERNTCTNALGSKVAFGAKYPWGDVGLVTLGPYLASEALQYITLNRLMLQSEHLVTVRSQAHIYKIHVNVMHKDWFNLKGLKKHQWPMTETHSI